MILKSDLQIFKAKDEDILSLVNLLKELFHIEKDFTFNQTSHEEGLRLLIKSKSSEILVVKFEGEIIGMITIQKIISTVKGSFVGLLEDFVIKEDYRDLGVGTYLFDYIKNYAIEKNLTRLQLVCDEDNEVAKEFYLSKKFNKSNLRAWYYHLV